MNTSLEKTILINIYTLGHLQTQRVGGRPWGIETPPLENLKAIGFLRNTGPCPIENGKATESVFNVGSSSAASKN